MPRNNAFPYSAASQTSSGNTPLELQVLLNIQNEVKGVSDKLHKMEIAQQHFVTKEEHRKDHEQVILELGKVSGSVAIVHEAQKKQLTVEQYKEDTFEIMRDYLAQETVLTMLQQRLKAMAREARKSLLEDLNFFPNFGKAILGILGMAGIVLGFIFLFNFFNGTPIQTQFNQPIQAKPVERGN